MPLRLEPRRPTLLLGLAAAIAALGAAGAFAFLRSERPIDEAVAVLEDTSHFGTSIEAGNALAHISDLLLEERRRCLETRGDSAACEGYLSATLYTQTGATAVTRCSLAEVDRIRRELLDYLRALKALPDGTEDADLPQRPGIRC